MRLIKPKQISGEIMTLLDEADKEVIIISPYIKVSEWNKLLNTFKNLQNRKVDLKIFYRENESQTFNEVKKLGIKAYPIKNLHCKIYLNEKQGVVSSMNLYKYSDENSLDIAYKTENKLEFDELLDFYKRYIEPNLIHRTVSLTKFITKLKRLLKKELDSKFVDLIKIDNNQVNIKTSSNNYWFGFDSENRNNIFWLEGIITSTHFDYANHIGNEFKENFGLDVELIGSEESRGYNYVKYQESEKIMSSSLSEIYEIDSEKFLPIIVQFIERTESFRNLFGQIKYQTW
ncbi:hypothetical protein [Winogradskyella ouciana]|uniref:hypothetical protein n=1 Tax=Winogradskyella ouciana TaxID=2608631 RepID=UPI003D26FAB8